MADSSFSYSSLFKGKTLMVIIPHEDDEINIAGSTIHGSILEGIHVICVFSTWGDNSYTPDIRRREAVKSLSTLGVKEHDIIFLGYPDGGVHGENAVYIHGDSDNFTVRGRHETYGTKAAPDFCMAAHGFHRPFTREGMIQDMEDVVLAHKPDAILCIDYDVHPDHRACSAAFKTAIGRILQRPGNKYFPVIFKGFAYKTAFESVPDFYAPHMLSTVFARDNLPEPSWETSNPAYAWDERIRLPVPEECRRPLLSDNLIHKAFCCHVSQKGYRYAAKVANGDQVFWKRRTDNLSMQAAVSASSGNINYLNDFLLLGSSDLAKPAMPMDDCLWAPSEDDKIKTCRLTFTHPVTIREAVLYGNIDTESRILDGTLRFSTGYEFHTGPFRKNGLPNDFSIEVQKSVDWVEFTINEAGGFTPGLTELELYEEEDTTSMIHILADGNFAYDWTVWPGEKPKISAWTYGSDDDVSWEMNGSPSSIGQIQEELNRLKKPITIRAFLTEHPDIWDEAVFAPDSSSALRSLRFHQKLDRWKNTFERFRQKSQHHALRKEAKKEKSKK